AAARIKLGIDDAVYLGNLDARRDWGYAPEYVDAMWRMLHQDQPRDYVIGTGQSHSVRDFLHLAFSRVDLEWQKYVKIDPRYYRPSEVENLRADATLARRDLDWEHKIEIRELANIMVDAELRALDGSAQQVADSNRAANSA